MSQRAFIKACMVFAFSVTWGAHCETKDTYCCLQTLVMWILHSASLFRWVLGSKHQHGDLLYFSKAPQELAGARKCFETWLTAGLSQRELWHRLRKPSASEFRTMRDLFKSPLFSPRSEASLDLFLQSHFTRAQANSPRPVMTSSGPNPKVSQGTLASQTQSQSQQSQLLVGQSHNSPGSSGREQREQRSSRSSRRKGSDSSVPEEDKDRREETVGRGEDESTCNTDGTLNVEQSSPGTAGMQLFNGSGCDRQDYVPGEFGIILVLSDWIYHEDWLASVIPPLLFS